jgi:pantetheine-phosphate adenylyltransferase
MEIWETASRLFDQLVVAPIRNPGKGEPLFTVDERIDMITDALAHLDNIKVVSMTKLTVDVARDVGADVIVKGLRVSSDFDSELMQAQMNKAISGIETVFLPCTSQSSFISASLVREIARIGGPERVGSLVPPLVAARLVEKLK